MRWQPAHEAHSIERVTLSFMLAEPLPIRGWQKVLEAAERRLPALSYHASPDQPDPMIAPPMLGGPGIQIRIAAAGVSLGGNASAGIPNARSYQRVVEGQSEGQIIVGRAGIVVTTTSYDKWQSFLGSIIETTHDMLSIIQDMSSISIVKLEIWDRFVFDGDPKEANFSELLRGDSPFVPSFAASARNLWHAHVGYFDEPGRSAQRLVNMNLDSVDIPDAPPPSAAEGVVASRRSLGIYTMAQDTPHKEGDVEPIGDIGGTLTEMHNVLNRLFAAVITDEAARRISLVP